MYLRFLNQRKFNEALCSIDQHDIETTSLPSDLVPSCAEGQGRCSGKEMPLSRKTHLHTDIIEDIEDCASLLRQNAHII